MVTPLCVWLGELTVGSSIIGTNDYYACKLLVERDGVVLITYNNTLFILAVDNKVSEQDFIDLKHIEELPFYDGLLTNPTFDLLAASGITSLENKPWNLASTI